MSSGPPPPPLPVRSAGPPPPPLPAAASSGTTQPAAASISSSGPPPPPIPNRPPPIPARPAGANGNEPPPPPPAANRPPPPPPATQSSSSSSTDPPATSTTGYVVSAKKTVSELLAQDSSDSSLAKYKATLLGSAGGGGADSAAKFPNDPRQIIFEKVEIIPGPNEGGKTIIMDIYDPELKNKPFVLKQGITFHPVLHFYVQHEIVSGLRFSLTVMKLGLKVDSSEEMVGSFAPSGSKTIVFRLPEETTPSGMLMRGNYTVEGKLWDDDGKVHAKWQYAIKITKDWE